MNWLTYTILSAVCFGFGFTLYKLPALQKLNRFSSTFWTNIFLSLIAVFASLLFSRESFAAFSIEILGISIVWGAVFSLNMFFQMSALKKMNAGVLFPVASALSTIMVVGIGLLFLSETVSWIKIIGIVVVLIGLFVFTKKDKKVFLDKQLGLYFIGIIITSILVKYLQKVAINIAGGDVLALIPIEHFWAAIFALVFGYIFYKKSFSKSLKNKREMVSGLKIAVPLFFAAYFLISALGRGELSQVFSVHPTYAVIVALLSAVIFKEKLGWKKLLIIVGIVIGIILIKMG